MKIVCIGDIHGKSCWRDIVKQNPTADKIVFIGDYFDCFEDVSTLSQINNFKAIVELKKSEPNKYVILIGNHDWHYMANFQSRTHYSGYQPYTWPDIRDAIESAKQYLQICYVQDKFVFSHAGISKSWAWKNSIKLDSIEKSVNELFETDPRAFNFASHIHYDSYGNHKDNGPLWIRPKALADDNIGGMVQVVGHTQTANYRPFEIDEFQHKGIILCDTFEAPVDPINGMRNTYYITIENGSIVKNPLSWEWGPELSYVPKMYS